MKSVDSNRSGTIDSATEMEKLVKFAEKQFAYEVIYKSCMSEVHRWFVFLLNLNQLILNREWLGSEHTQWHVSQCRQGYKS